MVQGDKRLMTTRALQILESTMELSMRPKSGDRQKLIARVIREVADRLCTDLGEMECPISALRKLADEIEQL
jgi:precorrin-2 methylase